MNLFCTECGMKLAPGDRYCTECGTTVPEVPSHTPREIASGDKLKPRLQSDESPAPQPSLRPVLHSPQTVGLARGASAAPSLTSRNISGSDTRPARSPARKVIFSLFGAAIFVGVVVSLVDTESLKAQVARHLMPLLVAEAPKPAVSAPKISLAARAQTPRVTVTARMLIDAASDGSDENFESILQKLEEEPRPPSGDRQMARPLNVAALAALKKGKFSQAAELLRQALQADPSDVEISDNLGYALQMMGRYEESESQQIAVLQYAPERASAWSNLADVSSHLGKSRQAVGAYIKAHRFSRKPEVFLGYLRKNVDNPDYAAARNNLLEAIQKIEAVKDIGAN